MQLPSRIRDSLNSAKVRTQVAIDRFDDWTEETFTFANLRAAPGKLWQAATRKDLITPAHFSGLKKTLRAGTTLGGQAISGLGKGWINLNEKADSAYQAVSRPVAMAGLGLIYGASAKMDTKRYQREQNKLLRQSAEIANQLRELAKLRPDFTFEEQLKPDSRTGYGQVVFTTNLPNTSNPDAPSTITVSHKGIETWGLGASMGSKTMKQLKGLLTGFVPEPELDPSGFGGFQFDFGASVPPAQAPEWERDVVKPVAPTDPIAYQAKQDKLSAQEDRVTEQLTRMTAENPGFAFETRRMFDEHHGTSKIVITTNIAARGKEAKPSDKLMLILSPDASDNGNLRIAGFANGGSNEGNEAHTLSALKKIAAITYPVPKAAAPVATAPAAEPTPEPAVTATTAPQDGQYVQKAPVTKGFHSSAYSMPNDIQVVGYSLNIAERGKPAPAPTPALSFTDRVAQATAHCEQLAQDNPNFKFKQVSSEGLFVVCTNIPAQSNAGGMRLIITPESNVSGQAHLENWEAGGRRTMACSEALNQLSACAYLHVPPVPEDRTNPKNMPILRVPVSQP